MVNQTRRLFLVVVSTMALASKSEAFESIISPTVDHFPIHGSCTGALIDQINMELNAALNYLNMFAYFNNPSIARYGYAEFFKNQADEEFGHAKKFIEYINKRNGTIDALKVQPSNRNYWNSPLDALEDAINLEKTVYAKIQHIHTIAEQKCLDAHLTDFLESYFFIEQVDSINELQSMKTRLISASEPSAHQTVTYLEDKRLLPKKQDL